MLYKDDYNFQRRWDHIEWVVPSTRKTPFPVCSTLDEVTDVDHWVGHNTTDQLSEVIDPQFFEDNKNVFPAKMLEYFKKKANHSHRFRDRTMKQLRKAADAAVPQGHVQRIERREEKDQHGEITFNYYGRTSANTRSLLSQQWLDVNFKVRYPSFYGKLMNTSSASKKDFFDVPEGTSKMMSSANIEKTTDAPRVQYQQDEQSSCVFSGLASALYAMGDTFAAGAVASLVHQSLVDNNGPFEFARMVMTDRYGHRKGLQKLRYSIQTWKEEEKFIPLAQLSRFPTMLHLVDSAGNEGHCVTVCGKWIFDSNHSHALPLSRDSLDAICDNVADHLEKITFKKVKNATRFIPPKAMQQKMINLLH